MALRALQSASVTSDSPVFFALGPDEEGARAQSPARTSSFQQPCP